MDFEASGEIVAILTEACRNNKLLSELLIDLLNAANRYARIRVDWYMADGNQRRIMDQNRSRAHNVFIDHCNILARNMAERGIDATWRSRLGDDRKAIGDFACYIHAYIGIMAR